jgi:hypothetical protein
MPRVLVVAGVRPDSLSLECGPGGLIEAGSCRILLSASNKSRLQVFRETKNFCERPSRASIDYRDDFLEYREYLQLKPRNLFLKARGYLSSVAKLLSKTFVAAWANKK